MVSGQSCCLLENVGTKYMRKATYGDWGKLRLVLDRRRERHETVVSEILAENAQKFVDTIVKTLDDQTFNPKPLSPAYLSSKRAQGLDTRVLIATGEMQSMFGWEQVTPKAVIAGAVVDKHEGSGLPQWQLVAMHEYGTASMPPRPFMRGVRLSLLPWWKKNWATYHERVSRA